jgi:hypothetical protein
MTTPFALVRYPAGALAGSQTGKLKIVIGA